MNQFLLGPVLGHNRARLIERCVELVSRNESHKFLYLAASHPLLEIISEGILDGNVNRGVWGELPVYLFRGFVKHILTTAIDEEGKGLTPRIPIDREELPLKRSLISQILQQLKNTGKLNAIGPLAGREGCINTIATLIGELQRSARTPAEVSAIIASRTQDFAHQSNGNNAQIEFDNEIALIYSTYCDALQMHGVTENDADQLRALSVLRGQVDGQKIRLPWLAGVELLILDGFFDFTPVQGEILRELIPRIPETLVNLNYDSRNPDIFAPFNDTLEQLSSMASFEKEENADEIEPAEVLSQLRVRLFNSSSENLQAVEVDASEDSDTTSEGAIPDDNDKRTHVGQVQYFECADRDTEIRSIAREVKRLVLLENYNLGDIALVVRQRDAYSKTITRVMREESVPCKLERRIDASDVPATRAALKLLELLEQPTSEAPTFRVADLADLIKSEYFRLGDEELAKLLSRFDASHVALLSEDNKPLGPEASERIKKRYRIGFWDADSLENEFAYVGSDLPIAAWLKRAEKLIQELPTATATKELLNIDAGAQDRDADIADQVENAETAKLEEKVERKRRPSRDIHPATLAWTSLVIQRFSESIFAVPRQGTPAELRRSLKSLLDQFGFRDQITRPTRKATDDDELPQVMLNFNALESLRRALVAAIKSFEMCTPVSDKLQFVEGVTGENSSRGSDLGLFGSEISQPDLSDKQNHIEPLIELPIFIAEVRRALGAQSQLLGPADPGGLRVLEATDVRGLKFKAIFIAGLVEGGFPLRAARDWIYPHEERERLKRYGLTLEDISPATLLKEEHYFYQSACRATERLYLSRPLLLEDDSETVASYYIDELRRAIYPVPLEQEGLRPDYDGKYPEDVSSSAELNVTLVRQQERHRHGSEDKLLAQPRIKRLLTLSRNDGFLSDAALRRIEIERERASRLFGPYDGVITDQDLLALLQQKFGPECTHSASGLTVFGNCPYRFFAQRVLKLEPRGEAALDLQAIDAGKLLHDILRRFFEKHRRETLNIKDYKLLRDELLGIADGVFDEHERVVPPLNKQIWKIDREIRKILLEQVLIYELDIQQEAQVKDVRPSHFEIAFGGIRSSARDPDSTDLPLELSRSTFVGEEKMKISGQIDRVDLARDNTIIAYDYKLSVGATKEDIRSARSLQIPIYLEALEKLILPGREVAGGGYYIIRGGKERRNRGLYRSSKHDYYNISAQTYAVMSDEEWQSIRAEVIAKIWEFLDQMRAGNFEVNPAERNKTCKFCDFLAVCRYDRGRIEGKKKVSKEE